MLTKERLETLLRRVPGATEVAAEPEERGFIALVVSPLFADQEEYERQAVVWSLLLDNLPEDEQAQVSYVFTNTPDEKAAAQAATGG
jgi:acid stress-induced BolA-like protein IbaG/YrbA